ncbi:MAG: signal peptidase I [Clostridia bacterium]|nr:signal peptidase I [Clostridia bacterium]
MKELLRWVVVVLFAVLAAFLIRTYVFNIAVVPTESMAPSVLVGDRVLVYKIDKTIIRGDAVVFTLSEEIEQSLPNDMRGALLLKRVIALPGESVEIVRGDVYINGELLEEPYVHEKGEDYMQKIELGDDEYFVLGDNRTNSFDARFWSRKFINASDINGKAVFRFGPIK